VKPSAKEMAELLRGTPTGSSSFSDPLRATKVLDAAAAHIEASEALRERLKKLLKRWRSAVEKGVGPTDRIIGFDICADELEAILNDK